MTNHRVGNFRLFFALAIAFAGLSARGAAQQACRPTEVVPYGRECDLAYHSIRRDQSIANVSAAYTACARAQNIAVTCVTSPKASIHASAVAMLYRDVTEQAEIAMFAQHFTIAEALLRERLDVLRALEHDGRTDASSLASERAAIAADLRDAKAGACTTRQYAKAPEQARLAGAHQYAALAKLLYGKYVNYDGCAPLATTPAKRAYIRYMALVALEESGRASQASGDRGAADKAYADCLAASDRESGAASATVRTYLANVHALCKGRMNGSLGVDQPQRLDAEGSKGFAPVVAPSPG